MGKPFVAMRLLVEGEYIGLEGLKTFVRKQILAKAVKISRSYRLIRVIIDIGCVRIDLARALYIWHFI